MTKTRESDASSEAGISSGRRGFLKKAGTIVVAAPVMESLTREGLLVRSAHAQSGPIGVAGPFGGPILDPP